MSPTDLDEFAGEVHRILDEASETGMLPWPVLNAARSRFWRKKKAGGSDPAAVAYFGNATDDAIEAAARTPGLRYVYINGVRGRRLDALKRLNRVEHLVLTNATQLTDLSSIAGMKSLRTLWLEHVPQVPNLNDLKAAKGLRGLYYTGQISASYGVRTPTLKPLAALKELRVLNLTGVNPRDGKLKPLFGLKHLRELWIANAYPLEQFAALAVAFPTLGPNAMNLWPGYQSMWWERPLPEGAPFALVLCQRCMQFTRGATKGKPIKRLCPTCDAARVAKFKAAWDAAVAASRSAKP